MSSSNGERKERAIKQHKAVIGCECLRAHVFTSLLTGEGLLHHSFDVIHAQLFGELRNRPTLRIKDE